LKDGGRAQGQNPLPPPAYERRERNAMVSGKGSGRSTRRKGPKSNKGLTARINMWALEKYLSDFDSEKARLWIKGEITNENTQPARSEFFNDAGELITILGRWNREQLKKLRKEAQIQVLIK
jgi:hypothetical protein